MRQVVRYTAMLLRAYVRDRSAVFFSLLLPLMFMLIFGALNLGAFGHVTMGIVDEARNADSRRFVDQLVGIGELTVREGALDDEKARLSRSERDMVVAIPADFRLAPPQPGASVPTLLVYANDGRAQQVAVGRAILQQLIAETSFAVTRTSPVVQLTQEQVSAVRLRYVDFLVPGILGMNVMQLAIFSVAFALVADKQRGVLRRIMATPFRPIRFLTSQVLLRLVLSVIQILILLGVALLVFKVQVVGSVLDLLVLTTLGSIAFLTVGFTLAGWAETVNQVPPVANLITLPQFFLSGVFFPTDVVPPLLKPISAAIAIGTGGPFGAEGPIIQTGGAFGSLVGQIVHTTAAERKVLLACGAAAGMSATFNTPIAGVILAIELLLFEFKSRSFIPLVIASTLATAVHMRLLGAGPMFAVAAVDFGIPRALPFYLLLGVICGFAALILSKSLYWVEDQFEKLPADPLWWPAIGALGLGIIGYFVPRVLGVGYDTIGDILNANLALKLLMVVMIAKAVALVISLGSGTSGGLLAPMFMSSAALGGVYALLMNRLFPSAALAPGAFALVAMGAVFGAASRATFTFIIFAFEITRDYNSVLPLMLSVSSDAEAVEIAHPEPSKVASAITPSLSLT